MSESTIDDVIRARPESLTYARAFAILPTLKINDEWQRKYDAGELPEGIAGLSGMLEEVWPDDKLSKTEAAWILALHELGSYRWLATIVLLDSNQIFGCQLVAAAQAALGATVPCPFFSETSHGQDD